MKNNKEKTAVIIPGSYDPVTLGHLDIIRRASEKFEEVYVVIFVNPKKTYTFSIDERIKMLILATDEFENVIVSASNGLVIDYMHEHGIKKIIKGYRNDVDLEYEKFQAEWNLLNGGYETILWQSSPELKNISSTSARQKLKAGEDLTETLPEKVRDFLKARLDKYYK